jgi:DNA-binding GntR family transcriptional regulator
MLQPTPRDGVFVSQQLAAEIAAHVRETILSGHIKPGEPLSIDRLARELEVSTTPVREALLSLHGEGFVIFQPRRGFRVGHLSRQDIKDLFWIQSEIAGELGARAATRLTDEDLRRLFDLNSAMQEHYALGDSEQVAALGHAFHKRINQGAGSAKLAWLLSIVVRYAPRRFGQIPGWLDTSIDTHQAVIDALRRRDPMETRTILRDHVLDAGRLLLDNLDRLGFWRFEEDLDRTSGAGSHRRARRTSASGAVAASANPGSSIPKSE